MMILSGLINIFDHIPKIFLQFQTRPSWREAKTLLNDLDVRQY